MKILIVNTLYYPDKVGGAEVSTQLLAEGLVRAGMEVSVACATGTGMDSISELNGVKVYRLRNANLYWPHRPKKRSRVARFAWHALDVYNVVMSRKLAGIIAQEKPDVIHTSNLACLSVDVWRVARNAGVPIVHTARDYYLMCPSTTMFSDAEPCKRQCASCALYSAPKRGASARVEVAIGVSRFVLQKHLDNGYFPHASRTAVVSNCYIPSEDSAALVNKRRYEGGPVRLGVLGRVARDKGSEVVLEQLSADHTLDWTLAFGGNGEAGYIASLKTKYRDPRVQFLGHVKASDFLNSIDILIVPSIWHEPFGRVIVEAYSHGLPVVGANRGGIPEVIEPRSGLVFDMDRPETLIQKIREAIELLKEPSVHDRLRKHADTFNPDTMVNAYLDIYRSALEGAMTRSAEPVAAAITPKAHMD
ncbi:MULTISPECIES: glycosyltransferase family 4 protein [unclassified Caballeronia]|uniref:glycosyltransferase family 4 protein n=1 Tax=unclassified Caballeronia TaxID=2646786 RepID=UPI002029A279|nr:glycosyltransferase family 4 protein [Caballeronia sp. Sq4a]